MDRNKGRGGGLYGQQEGHLLAVDSVIFGFDGQKLKLLCIKRNFEPEKGNWSLMGGFVRSGEGLDQAAERVLEELTGLSDIYLEQIQAYGSPGRDPESRVVSVAYYALIDPGRFDGDLSKAYDAHWFDLGEAPELIFDHRQMVSKALRRLKRRSISEPVGFELLPEKFTLPQLMLLYEAIFQKEFDKRNFRRKILASGTLVKLEEKDMKSSRKGAYYYKFDLEKYNTLKNSGVNFDLSYI